MDECPKIGQKYLWLVTIVAQPPKRLRSLPRSHMKDNGHIYLFVQIHLVGEALFLLLIDVEVQIYVM